MLNKFSSTLSEAWNKRRSWERENQKKCNFSSRILPINYTSAVGFLVITSLMTQKWRARSTVSHEWRSQWLEEAEICFFIARIYILYLSCACLALRSKAWHFANSIFGLRFTFTVRCYEFYIDGKGSTFGSLPIVYTSGWVNLRLIFSGWKLSRPWKNFSSQFSLKFLVAQLQEYFSQIY